MIVIRNVQQSNILADECTEEQLLNLLAVRHRSPSHCMDNSTELYSPCVENDNQELKCISFYYFSNNFILLWQVLRLFGANRGLEMSVDSYRNSFTQVGCLIKIFLRII